MSESHHPARFLQITPPLERGIRRRDGRRTTADGAVGVFNIPNALLAPGNAAICSGKRRHLLLKTVRLPRAWKALLTRICHSPPNLCLSGVENGARYARKLANVGKMWGKMRKEKSLNPY